VNGSAVTGNTKSGIYNIGALTLTGSTVSGNTASGGTVNVSGGIENDGTGILINSIVSGNSATTYPDIESGSYTDNGGNLVGSSTANLAPLGSYGGATQTMIALRGSAAICAGSYSLTLKANNSALSSELTTDQRGDARTNSTYTGYRSSAPCVDAGAVQSNYSVNVAAPAPVSPVTSINAGAAFTDAVTLYENGSAFTGASASIQALIFTGTGVLSGSTATATNASTGIANFSGLTVNDAGTGDVLTETLQLNPYLATVPSVTASSSGFAVLSPVSLTTPSPLADGTAGVAYTSLTFAATGGSGSYTFSQTSGSLPTGVSLVLGVLSGTPTVGGVTSSFTIQATYAANSALTGSTNYSLTVNAPTLGLSATPLASVTYGTSYSSAITAATGGSGNYTYALATGSSLPASLSLNASTGAITGIPTAASTVTFTITATDTGSTNTSGANYTISQTYSINKRRCNWQ
jgi:hypothetical protein